MARRSFAGSRAQEPRRVSLILESPQQGRPSIGRRASRRLLGSIGPRWNGTTGSRQPSRRPAPELPVRIHYPAGAGRIVLRTDCDWEADVEASEISDDRCLWVFRLPVETPQLRFKPVLRDAGGLHWARAEEILILANDVRPVNLYPHFFDDRGYAPRDLRELFDPGAGIGHTFHVLVPEGYAENPLRRYPVLYMQDGRSIFSRKDAPEDHWHVAETLTLLVARNVVPMIVVDVTPQDPEGDFSAPGYEAYGRWLVERLKPAIDAELRTLAGPRHTGVMGSRLGGVVSLYLAWEHPDVFGLAACIAGAFGRSDELRERVAKEPKPSLRLYLDSGEPGGDEDTGRMRDLLLERGFRDGDDLLYCSFPEALDVAASWPFRAHLPLRYLWISKR